MSKEKSEVKEVYKVVIYLPRDKKVYHSTSNPPLGNTNPIGLTYRLGRWTKPLVGKIFCFKDYSSAEQFFNEQWSSYYRYSILKGVGVNPSKIHRISVSQYRFIDYWKIKRAHKKVDRSMHCSTIAPKGTVVVDKFKPTKLLEFKKA